MEKWNIFTRLEKSRPFYENFGRGKCQEKRFNIFKPWIYDFFTAKKGYCTKILSEGCAQKNIFGENALIRINCRLARDFNDQTFLISHFIKIFIKIGLQKMDLLAIQGFLIFSILMLQQIRIILELRY